MSLQAAEIHELIETCNAAEIERRRDYHQYLVERGDQSETFEEHLEKFAMIVRTGETATPAEIRDLEGAIGRPLPPELAELYTTIGRLIGLSPRGQLEIPSVRRLLQRMKDPSVPAYEKLCSLGLADMMRAPWGNERPELDPENGTVSAEGLEAINQAYTCIGWIRNDPGEEGHTYVYFDRDGRFGTVFYHQDDLEEICESGLLSWVEQNPERQTLSEILIGFLR